MGEDDPRTTVYAQSKPPAPDLDHVLTQDEISTIHFDSADDAFNYYRFLVRSVALQSKMAFITDLWKTVKQKPELLGALAADEDGKLWLEAFTNSEAAFMSFMQPNFHQTMNRVRNWMETVTLPKQYGIGVKGRLPLFTKGALALSYSDVIVTPASAQATYDFGDLYKSTVQEDIKAINDLVRYFKVTPKLGELTTAAIVVLSITALLITMFLYAGWVDYLKAKEIPPEVKKVLEHTSPEQLERILEKWGKIGGLFGGLSDVLMWAAIGAGVLVVGGGALYIATK